MALAVAFIYAAGAVICHQMPERSFFVAGYQLPVCARCTGLYVAAALAMTGWWGLRMRRRLPPIPMTPNGALRAIAIAAMPTAVSWSLGVAHIWDGTNTIRALLALPLGAAAGTVVAAVTTKDLR